MESLDEVFTTTMSAQINFPYLNLFALLKCVTTNVIVAAFVKFMHTWRPRMSYFILQTFLCNIKVEKGQLDAEFRAAMRSRHLRRDKELEILTYDSGRM